MRFVEFTWLAISLVSLFAGGATTPARKKSATLNLLLSGNRIAQASAQAEKISSAQLDLQNLRAAAAVKPRQTSLELFSVRRTKSKKQ
jgi:hypothetical protein